MRGSAGGGGGGGGGGLEKLSAGVSGLVKKKTGLYCRCLHRPLWYSGPNARLVKQSR